MNDEAKRMAKGASIGEEEAKRFVVELNELCKKHGIYLDPCQYCDEIGLHTKNEGGVYGFTPEWSHTKYGMPTHRWTIL